MFESEQWDRILFWDVTLRQFVIYVLVACAALWVLAKLYVRLFGSGKADYTVHGKCTSCRWEGKVSKYKAVCPRCGSQVRIGQPRSR